MGGSWVLFFISDNQEIQHGSPGVLGLIFYNGQPRIRVAVLGLIFYIGRPKNSNMRVQVDWVPSVLGLIFYNGQPRNPTLEARCTGFIFITDNQD